jgi:UDP-2,4-diacetamido-2,4,6-trideoxy-beta-L-altropyranose hydrolase
MKMSKPWLFRVASHPSQGGGHVARSSSLARAFMSNATPVIMALDADSPDARRRLEQLGLDCVLAGKEGPGPWAGTVIDGYWYQSPAAPEIASYSRPLVWLDDFLQPPKCVDLVVNASCGLSGSDIRGIPALLGPRYALIDPRYAVLHDRDRARPVERLIVSFGRVDPENCAGKMLEAFNLLAGRCASPEVTVVVSAASPHLPMLQAKACGMAMKVTVITEQPDMVSLLDQCDFVVGAGGVSLMERMAAGLPSLTMVIAENQRVSVGGAAAAGATFDAGDAGALTPEKIAEVLVPLLTEPSRRVAMAKAGRRLIDGQGPNRVAEYLASFTDTWRRSNDIADIVRQRH